MRDEWKLPWEGGCRCGTLRFRVTKPPLLSGACHCRGCQQMTASAYSLSLVVPADGFEVIAGEPSAGGLNRDMHYGCPSCLAWAFTRPKGLDDMVFVRPTLLDEHNWFVPFFEVFTSEKLPWASVPAKHSYAKFPEPDDYPRLMAEFAAECERP